MKRNLLPIGLGLTIGLLALFLRDFVREEVVIPLLKLVRFVEDLPQNMLWFFFLGIMVFFAYKSLNKWRPPGLKVRRPKTSHRGQIELLVGLIEQARQEGYFRERLARYLGELTLETLALQERLTPEIMKEHLRSGTLDVPPEILDYLRAGLISDSPHYGKRGKMYFRSEAQSSPLELDPGLVVEFLEHQLEGFSGIQDL